MEYEDLMNRLKFETNVFQGRGIEDAFRTIDRRDFLDEDYKFEAYEDYAVPIGFGKSLTQPTTLAFMLELLDVQLGDAVLNVGSGSGFSTALLSKLIGQKGQVIAIEIIPELLQKSIKNLDKYNLSNINLKKSIVGRLENTSKTYNKILVNASASEVPEYLLDQLEIGGTMVVPIQDKLTSIKKTSAYDYQEKSFEGFSFEALQ